MSGAGTQAAGSSEWTLRSPAITRKQGVGAEAALGAVVAAAVLVAWLRRRSPRQLPTSSKARRAVSRTSSVR